MIIEDKKPTELTICFVSKFSIFSSSFLGLLSKSLCGLFFMNVNLTQNRH